MAMQLYNVTLQKPTAITLSIDGNFSEAKAKELIVVRGGRTLELLRFEKDVGRMVSVFSQEVFGVIRAIVPFRLTAGNRDYIIIGSDSGRITILEFDGKKNIFVKVHEETFGRSGCRRIVPGQYVAADPRGRAVMVGAVEKQKFVYIINRDNAARLTISSPLDFHKSHTICFDLVGVDVGFENPIFAAIEVDYEEQNLTGEEGEDIQKHLTFYELDLGLNHVVRKWNDPIDPTSNKLFSVPGGKEGPGGVLVCAENFVYWKNMEHADVHCALPRRSDMDESRGLMIISGALFKRRDVFFFILQSEFGDLYKIELEYSEDIVNGLSASYFDTIAPSLTLSIIRPAFLFSGAESTNHALYQFVGAGEDDGEDSREGLEMTDSDFDLFRPRSLKNLELLEQMDNLGPLLHMQIKDLAREATPQIYGLCGSGVHSSLRVLRHGLEVNEVANSGLPGNPSALWTVKKSPEDSHDCYIVISFTDSTLLLAIGDNIEEVTEESSGFVLSAQTLYVRQLGSRGILQILPNSVRYIKARDQVKEWRAPAKKQIQHASANQRQVVIALTGGEIYYFQLDDSDQLVEVARKDMGNEASCLDIAPLEEGRVTARFLAVADWDKTVRILSLDREDCLQTITYQALPSQPMALCLLYYVSQDSSLFLNIGLQDGVLLRISLDPLTGDLSDVRRRFLGVRPVKLIKLTVNGAPAMLALSSRSWLAYNFQSRFHLTPLSYDPAECASGFSSEQCPEGLITTTENSLRIITMERLGEVFNQQEIQLKFTPRSFVVHKPSNLLVLIESEHNSTGADADVAPSALADGADASSLQYVRPKAGGGKWASCVRLYDVNQSRTLASVMLDANEAATSVTICNFPEKSEDTFVAVGTTVDLQLTPRKFTSGYIRLYRLAQENNGEWSLTHLYKTEVDEIPGALSPFQGRLLAGVGNVLRIYDMGKKKLLRKCENRDFPRMIKTLHTSGSRIIVGDISQSFLYVKYRHYENQLLIFADDTAPRWVTASCMLDYDSMAGGDKFGNVFICRLPQEIAQDVEEDPTAAHLQHLPYKGAPHKVAEIIQFHVGEVITHLSKASLVPGGADVLLYATIHGAIGALVPFVSRDDVDFFSTLEMQMRQNLPPLCGRDHMAYRSYYFPVKNVIDGDLCEQFSLLDSVKQEVLAEELGRPTREVLKKLEDFRNRCL